MNLEYKIKFVCDYIQLHLDDELDVEKLCHIALLSKFHFHRIFTAQTGITLIRFIQMARLKRASYQLAFEKDLRIIEIALNASFESPESFSRAFKRHFDQTPTEFRQAPNWQYWHLQFNYDIPKIEKKMIVNVIERPSEKIAFLRHRGDPHRVLETAARFIAWRKKTGLSPVKLSKTYGIPYSDPEIIAQQDFIFDIAGSVLNSIPENEFSVENAVLPAGRYAIVRHYGSHESIKDSVYYIFREWLPNQDEEAGDFPIYFQYLNFVHEVDEHELMTDIFLLLKEK